MLVHGLIEDRMQFSKNRCGSAVSSKRLKKYKVHIDRAERVAKFAMALFEQTRGTLHNWGTLEQELLWSAAILHNCGHFISHSAHHKHSYYLIRNGELLGYAETELEGHCQHCPLPPQKCAPKKKHDNFQNLPTPLPSPDGNSAQCFTQGRRCPSTRRGIGAVGRHSLRLRR